jgi:SagB-type dehydrogenase family enzyme
MRKLSFLVLLLTIFAQLLSGQVRINENTIIEFATVKQGRNILGAKDDYSEKLSRFDLTAKMQTDKPVTRQDYLANAADSVVSWTDEEKKNLEPALEQIKSDLSFLKWQFPQTVYLIKTTGKEEGGMSYTRGNGVVLHGGRGGGRAKGLITHELFHVLSRHNPEMRDQLYATIGFKKCNDIVIPEPLSQIMISNPDAPKNQHYIEVTYEGKKVCAVPILFSNRPKYDVNEGGSFSMYMKSKLLIVQEDANDKQFKPVLKAGEPLLVDRNDVNGFYEQVGRNTGYLIHPEEAMASNFAILAEGRSDVPSPEILEKMRAVLTKNEQGSKAADPNKIKLVKPQTDGGKTLMQALKERKTSREFSSEKLPMQVLSNMLWAANGINRPDSGKRTAPTAVNWQEIDIYVAIADGLYIYDANANTLNRILAEDIRAATGSQPFVKDAPVNLIFVSDFSKMGNAKEEDKVFYSATDTGFISQNVYLFCASEGLATVVRGWVDRPALSKVMKLRSDQKIILAQTVGYPKKK